VIVRFQRRGPRKARGRPTALLLIMFEWFSTAIFWLHGHDHSVIVLASRSDTVFSLSTGNQEPGTGNSCCKNWPEWSSRSWRVFQGLPRPQGVLARSFCDRTGIAKRYGVLFIYREPRTGNWEHSLVFFIDTVHRAQLGNVSNSPFGRGGAKRRGG